MQTFVDLMEHVAPVTDRPVLISGETALTGKELASSASRLARALLAKGVAHGDRVAIWLVNGPEFVLGELAAAMIGAVVVPIQPRYGTTELAKIVDQARPKVLLYQRGFRNADLDAVLGRAYPDIADGVLSHGTAACGIRHAFSVGGSAHPGVHDWDAVLDGDAGAEALEAANSAVQADDPALCVFTSGTTGMPKGAMLSHGAILATETAVGDILKIEPGERVFYSAPLASVFGCCNALVATLTHRGCLVLMPTFEAGEALDLIETYSCSVIYAVPTMVLALMEHPDFAPERTQSLRTGILGGAPASAELVRRVTGVLGVRHMLGGYGMSETCAIITINRIGDSIEDIADTVGQPLPGVEVRIVDAQQQDRLVPAEEGEICMRGINRMLGYLDPAGGLREPWQDGWFRTGDIGSLTDKGMLRITGRVSDMILVGGFNVYPSELEAVIETHPASGQCSVVGVPDARMGEKPVAFIRLLDGQGAVPADLAAFTAERLAKYKVPAHFIEVAEFPMTPLGKVIKAELKAMAKDHVDGVRA